MSEDDEINFYPPSADGLKGKGLRKTPNHPDMVFKSFIKFTGLPESKIGKNSHLMIFDILLNPFTTEPQAIFLLLENDNLGIIN